MQLWDKAGHTSFDSLTDVFILGKRVVIYAFSVDSVQSLHRMRDIIERVRANIGKAQIEMVVGLKSDLRGTKSEEVCLFCLYIVIITILLSFLLDDLCLQVTEAAAREVAQSFNIQMYAEASSKVPMQHGKDSVGEIFTAIAAKVLASHRRETVVRQPLELDSGEPKRESSWFWRLLGLESMK
jgi:GTPase SAR1 family protein